MTLDFARTRRALGRLCLPACLLLTVPLPALPAGLNRPADPVVLTGADVPGLRGISPASLVAWRYGGTWQQIPVQVDERAVVDLHKVYNNTLGLGALPSLVYTDAGTFTGPDPDTTLDSDDEIVFMAKDAGNRPSSFSEPAGVVAGSGVEVAVSDPLDPGASGYVYLFRQKGSLDPGAGQRYVTYQFKLLSGSYLSTYHLSSGTNPENSTATTAYYSHHFSDRWIDDELHIYAGNATGVNILDRHKNLFAPGVCTRSEDTFSASEGAFIINKSGPVRAIRSYLGANSGPYAERDHFYYERRQDIVTTVRVHAIAGVMDFFDYSPAASGMRYSDNLNSQGVVIDGVPDQVNRGTLTWEMVTGAQGSLIMALDLATDIPGLSDSSFYEDDISPPDKQCTGDPYSYGASGFWVLPLPCTDPTRPECSTVYHLQATRTLYYAAPGATSADAAARQREAASPLKFTVAKWQGQSSVEANEGRPGGFWLYQNYPDPFNPSTTIGYSVARPARVRITLFTSLGQEVVRLLDAEAEPGYHEVRFDASALASGTYLYKLEIPAQGAASGYAQTRKLLLIR